MYSENHLKLIQNLVRRVVISYNLSMAAPVKVDLSSDGMLLYEIGDRKGSCTIDRKGADWIIHHYLGNVFLAEGLESKEGLKDTDIDWKVEFFDPIRQLNVKATPEKINDHTSFR